jgi:hypothetical protein
MLLPRPPDVYNGDLGVASRIVAVAPEIRRHRMIHNP